MTDKCIADEVIREIQRGTLFSLVTECAEGLGYSIQRAYETAEERPMSNRFMIGNPSQALLDRERHLRTRLALFAINKNELESTGTGTMVQLGTVLATPIPPNMRVQVWCESDWQGIGFDPGFTPCEVGAAIMRFLLRMVEGVERADAWRAPWERQEAAEAIDGKSGTNDHWAYSSPKKRAEIVEHYRRARKAGEVSNKEAWAQSHYGIRARTLRRYEVEYDNRPDT